MAWQINMVFCVRGIMVTGYYIREILHMHLEPIKVPMPTGIKSKKDPKGICRSLEISGKASKPTSGCTRTLSHSYSPDQSI